jgi:hypothetical protein
MGVNVQSQLLSVVIPTHNRAVLLRPALESLVAQTLDRAHFEVVIVDDGSTDNTPALCREFARKLPLRYFRIMNSGISSAKNLGVFASVGSLVLFFDDDDIADPDLLRQHVDVHEQLPAATAVLGFTGWAPGLEITPVMDYVMNKGFLLFSYSHLTAGDLLDFTYFWGGRTSCKRLLLIKHGVFNQNFPRIIEDIELGYRLSRFGLKVKFHPAARQYMNRPIGFDAFCKRCEAQGHAFLSFSRLHADPVVQDYCLAAEATDRWIEERENLPHIISRVHTLEAQWKQTRSAARREAIVAELDPLYARAFRAHRAKGTAEAAGFVAPADAPAARAVPPARSRRRSAIRQAARAHA